MKKNTDSLRLIAIFLLIFLIVLGVSIWLLDLVAQQRTFGFLLGAELVAFALLVYLYYEENPHEIDKRLLSVGFASILILVIMGSAVFAGVGALPKPNVSVTLYAGEISSSQYGFGNSSTSITSPGPTLMFKVGDVVNMTLIDAGKMSHNWALVTTNQTSASVLFGAMIDSGSIPLSSNESASVIFRVAKAGNYFYICQVAGHVQLGMWGSVIINP